MGAARLALAVAASLIAATTVGGCGGADGRTELRLGYFPNITHAQAVIGVQQGTFADALGDDVTLTTTTFNAGPAAVEALFSDAIDIVYIGPGPATNAYAKSRGQAVRVIAGSAANGAALVVKPEITRVAQLRGRKIASPQLGNTQDIALRHHLKKHGLATDPDGGGDVTIVPQDNAHTLETFTSGAIDGAWVPEPWAYRLQEAGGRTLVDERDLWPDRTFVTTHVVVRTEFLTKHPDVVKRFLTGHLRATETVNTDPRAAQRMIADAIGEITGTPLPLEIVRGGWRTLLFTNDPIAPSLLEGAEHAEAVGLLDPVDDLEGIYDLRPLNEVLAEHGHERVSGP